MKSVEIELKQPGQLSKYYNALNIEDRQNLVRILSIALNQCYKKGHMQILPTFNIQGIIRPWNNHKLILVQKWADIEILDGIAPWILRIGKIRSGAYR